MKSAIALFVLASVCSTGTALAQDDHNDHNHGNSGHIRRVLLISIDGMHAVDFANCVKGIPSIDNGHSYCPALAALGKNGINYVAASTSKPSDSFPGLTAIITGGSPALTGVYYDVAYSRNYDAPAKTTGNGVAAGTCKAFGTPTGTTTEYEEGIDIDQTKLNGGAPGATLTDGGINSIDPMRLPRDPNNGCNPVFPWEFVRANSIFSVIHKAGGYAAWSDKHPAYSSVASGLGPAALDDFYAPEINSNVVALPAVQTPTGLSCATVPDSNSDLTAWTNSFQNIQCYDTLKVNAIVNEIDGMDHLGKKKTRVPTIFGMNFQAVSVGQKLIEASNNVGGYLDAAGTPSANLLSEIRFVDASIEEFVDKLQANGLYDSTLIVITAKHGQSPIDPNRYVSNLKKGSSPATLLSNAGFIPDSESTLTPGGIGPTEDDVSLLWLKSSSQTVPSVAILEANAAAIGLGQIYYGPSVAINYNDPTKDPRTPDIIVTPNVGVTYSGSSAKQAEHGGFAHDDTNVMLLLSNVNFEPKTVRAQVGTAQVAPTILDALGIDPSQLDAVRAEGVSVLPDFDTW
jgi:hypothetical protein